MSICQREPTAIQAFVCETASVAEGAMIVNGSANNKVRVSNAADTTAIPIGLAHKAGSSSTNKPLDVVTEGIWPGIAAASISLGDILVAADTSGGLKPLPGSPTAGEAIIGEALESANSGERVAVRINPRPYGK